MNRKWIRYHEGHTRCDPDWVFHARWLNEREKLLGWVYETKGGEIVAARMPTTEPPGEVGTGFESRQAARQWVEDGPES